MSRALLGLSSVAAVTVTVITLTGCSSGTAKVSKAEVEKKTATELTKIVGQKPDDVTCPSDLTAKVGTKMTCVLTAGDEKIDVYLTVNSVKDDNTRFHIRVADHPN